MLFRSELTPRRDGEFSDNKESILSLSTLIPSIILLRDKRKEIQNEAGTNPKKSVPQNLSTFDQVCHVSERMWIRSPANLV